MVGTLRTGGDRGDLPLGEIGQEGRTWAQWQATFSDEADPDFWIEERLRFTPHSHWMVLLDLENDILADNYLPDSDMIKVGSKFKFDVYDVIVGDCV